MQFGACLTPLKRGVNEMGRGIANPMGRETAHERVKAHFLARMENARNGKPTSRITCPGRFAIISVQLALISGSTYLSELSYALLLTANLR